MRHRIWIVPLAFILTTMTLVYAEDSISLVSEYSYWLATDKSKMLNAQIHYADSSRIHVVSTKCSHSKDRIAYVAGLIDAPVSEVWQEISDYDRYGQLIPRCTRSLVVNEDIIPAINESRSIPNSFAISEFVERGSYTSGTILLYSEIDIIFPVGRIRSVLELTSDSVKYVIHWKKIVSSLKAYEGAWELIPFGNKTLVVCMMRYRLNVWMPPFIIHSAVRYYFPQIIKTLRCRIREVEMTEFLSNLELKCKRNR